MSFSKGVTIFTGGVETLGAKAKIGAGKEATEDSDINDATVDTGTSITFSIRLCAVVGSMTAWLSSSGEAGPVTMLSDHLTVAFSDLTSTAAV